MFGRFPKPNSHQSEEKMKSLWTLFALFVIAALTLSACGSSAPQADSLLEQIQQRGTIVISTDPNYEPQSFINPEGRRLSETKCAGDQLTAPEMQGFDVDVAIELGKRLGVETCFATPSWDAITAGSWADKWDVSVGSMTITTGRQEILNFSVPYYYYTAVVAAKNDSGINSLSDLSGKNLCAATATTYELWANGQDTGLPASSIYQSIPANVTVVTLETDQECAQAIAAGRTDFLAYVTASTVVDANIAADFPVYKVGEAVYSEELAAAIDKSASLPTETLLAAVNKAISDMHADGTLSALSIKWFGEDLTADPNK
jgi:polar amino acid transport system substrate-binding protein